MCLEYRLMAAALFRIYIARYACTDIIFPILHVSATTAWASDAKGTPRWQLQSILLMSLDSGLVFGCISLPFYSQFLSSLMHSHGGPNFGYDIRVDIYFSSLPIMHVRLQKHCLDCERFFMKQREIWLVSIFSFWSIFIYLLFSTAWGYWENTWHVIWKSQWDAHQLSHHKRIGVNFTQLLLSF